MRCNYPWTKNVDEELLQNFYRQQLERSSHVKNALSLYQSDIVLVVKSVDLAEEALESSDGKCKGCR